MEFRYHVIDPAGNVYCASDDVDVVTLVRSAFMLTSEVKYLIWDHHEGCEL